MSILTFEAKTAEEWSKTTVFQVTTG